MPLVLLCTVVVVIARVDTLQTIGFAVLPPQPAERDETILHLLLAWTIRKCAAKRFILHLGLPFFLTKAGETPGWLGNDLG